MREQGRLAPLVGALVVTWALLGALGGLAFAVRPLPHHSRQVAIRADVPVLSRQEPPAPPLTPASAPPQPAAPVLAQAPPLLPHELFGFAPYWTLDQAGGFNVRALSTVAYFGVDVNADGSLVQSGPGWEGYQSQQLADLVTAAHAAGDHAVLTFKTFDPPTLHRLATDPAVPSRLAQAMVTAIQAKNLDGANLDFEGAGSADRAGFAALVRSVATSLHAVNRHWQVTVDTYASSASNPDGWFDVEAMAPTVDAFFVMAYDMYQQGVASPNAPLVGGGGTTDAEAVAAYSKSVGSAKVILGTPFYGYDWTTDSNTQGARATQPPRPVAYAEIAAKPHPAYWDKDHQVPWTAYQDGSGSWHELYYDDPTSLALKARLANTWRLAGVGIWALGMDGNSPAMLAALLGNARPAKYVIDSGGSSPAPGASPAPTASSSRPGQGPGSSPSPHSSPSPSPQPAPTPPPPPPPPSVPPLPVPSPPL